MHTTDKSVKTAYTKMCENLITELIKQTVLHMGFMPHVLLLHKLVEVKGFCSHY